MNVLLIGSGGREHAIAWKLAQSPHVERLYNLPGNPGTGSLGVNLKGDPANAAEVVRLAAQHRIGLVVIGPEAPLAAGLADKLRAAGFLVFGPSQAAAQIETSKAFAKEFMRRHGIPSARFQVFEKAAPARQFIRSRPFGKPGQSAPNFVIKASGLAAGKGVFLPPTLEEAEGILQNLLVEDALGAAGRQVVIEERLEGPEVSALAFCDGTSLLPMPPAQDHKRLLEGDRGPNTGGMGAVAPTPLCPPALLEQVRATILQPAVDGLRAEARPFVGVLYAGLMLTPDGPRVLEFNSRFGDPETQAILLLLESDLFQILLACAQGNLAQAAGEVKWSADESAAVIVLASRGYGMSSVLKHGVQVSGLDSLPEGVLAFHAGAAIQNRQLVTAGGRVLGIAARGKSLAAALELAYSGVACIDFAGMYYRSDIGRSLVAAHPQPAPGAPASAYEAAGVSIDSGNRAASLLRQAVRSTYGPQVLSDVGSFGGLFSAAELKALQSPVLVASTDGVGTKAALAAQAGMVRGIGQDIVNHCVNDILVQGARPLFFLDYFAAGSLRPELVAEIVAGMSLACREVGCALLGGETAEMPGIYTDNSFDVAGTIVGVVEREALLPRPGVRPGDVLVGLAASGPHTNGYSLIRRIFREVPLDRVDSVLETSLAEALLAPHRSYLGLLGPLLPGGAIKALAHITGGGLVENLPRVLPDGCGARLHKDAWPVPPVFRLIQERGKVAEAEMYRVFNMGIGMAAVVGPEQAAQLQAAIPEKTWVIGEVTSTAGVEFV